MLWEGKGVLGLLNFFYSGLLETFRTIFMEKGSQKLQQRTKKVSLSFELIISYKLVAHGCRKPFYPKIKLMYQVGLLNGSETDSPSLRTSGLCHPSNDEKLFCRSHHPDNKIPIGDHLAGAGLENFS